MSNILIILIIVLIIILPIYFYSWHSRRKDKRKLAEFTAYCQKNNFAIKYLLQRSDQLAALSEHGDRIAWCKLSHGRVHDPIILSIQGTERPKLRIARSNQAIQKIFFKPGYKSLPKGIDAPEIVFYEDARDNYPLIPKYREEAMKWEEVFQKG